MEGKISVNLSENTEKAIQNDLIHSPSENNHIHTVVD